MAWNWGGRVGPGAQTTCNISKTVQDGTNVSYGSLIGLLSIGVQNNDLEWLKRHSCRTKIGLRGPP